MFCKYCGKEIPNNTNFCIYCGSAQNSSFSQNIQSSPRADGQQQSTVHTQSVHTVPPSLNSKKSSTKKKVGIVFVFLQILVLIGGISNGSVMEMLDSGPYGFCELLGYCAMGIIGAILIYKGNKKAK